MDNLIRVGIVTDRSAEDAAVRVVFTDQDNQVSDWLPVIVAQAGKSMSLSMPDIDDTVVCLFLESGMESGYCVGAIYTSDTPTNSGDVIGIWLPNGNKVSFDRSTGVLDIVATGNVNITAPKVNITGDLVVSGTVQQGGG